MAIFPPIPTRFKFSGDQNAGRRFVGFGKKRLADLVTSMGFQKLKTGENFLQLADGSVIKTSMNYGVSKIEIFVPLPFSRIEKRIRVVEETVSFYWRMVNKGENDYALGILTDRLVIWEMQYEGINDLELSSVDINHAGDFTPGAGSVVLDVDLESGEVFFPIYADEEERLSLINKATKFIERIDEEDDSFPDVSGDMFEKGYVLDPYRCMDMCNDAPDPLNSSIKIDGSLVGVTGKNYPMLYKVGNIRTWSDVNDWRSLYCPSNDGTPENDLLSLILPKIEENRNNYGNFYFGVDNTPLDYYSLTGWTGPTCTFSESYDGLYAYHAYRKSIGCSIVDGMYFAANIAESPYAAFFVIFKNNSAEEFNITSNSWSGRPGSYFQGLPLREAFYVWPSSFYDGYFPAGGNLDIITPLEVIEYPDVSVEFTASGLCRHSIFNLGENVAYSNYARDPSMTYHRECQAISTQLPSGYYDPSLGSNSVEAHIIEYARSARTTYSNTLDILFKVQSTTNKNIIGGGNFAALFISSENYYRALNYYRAASYYSGPDSYFCGSNTAGSPYFEYYGNSVEDVPIKSGSNHFFVIYLFAPEYFSKKIDEIDTYWDIHSARNGSGGINPYRCLVLEEHLLGIISETQEYLRGLPDSVGTPTVGTARKYHSSDSDSIYYLSKYGYEQSFGFVIDDSRKKVETKTRKTT